MRLGFHQELVIGVTLLLITVNLKYYKLRFLHLTIIIMQSERERTKEARTVC